MSSLKYIFPSRLLLMDVKRGVPRGPLKSRIFPAAFLIGIHGRNERTLPQLPCPRSPAGIPPVVRGA